MAFSSTTTLLFTVLAVALAADCKDSKSPSCASIPDDHINLLQGQQKLQLGFERARFDESRDVFFQRIAMIEGARRFFENRARTNETQVPKQPCADNDAQLIEDLGGVEGAKSAGIPAKGACATVKAQRWCMSDDDVPGGRKVEEWMGLVCPQSCGWCNCADDVATFNGECPHNPICAEESKKFAKEADPCIDATGLHWCNAEVGAHAKWMIFLCRKSCCDHWSKGGEGKEHASCAVCRKR